MKKLAIAVGMLLLALIMSACGCKHEWKKETCLAPQTCSLCGETQGEALGHKWIDADCENAKTCSVCRKTEGEPLVHELDEWMEEEKNIIEGTVTVTRTCTICNKVVEKENRNIDTLIEEGVFLFEGKEFAERLNIALKKSCDSEKEDLFTAEYQYTVTEEGIIRWVTIYNGKGKEIAVIFPSEYPFSYFEVDIMTDGLMSSALVYRSIIMTCDPQQTYYEATSIGKSLLTQCTFDEKGFGEYSENSIYYKIRHLDTGGFSFFICVEDE